MKSDSQSIFVIFNEPYKQAQQRTTLNDHETWLETSSEQANTETEHQNELRLDTDTEEIVGIEPVFLGFLAPLAQLRRGLRRCLSNVAQLNKLWKAVWQGNYSLTLPPDLESAVRL